MTRPLLVLALLALAPLAHAASTQALLDSAFVHLGRGEHPEAEAKFRRVLAADSASARAHYGMGLACSDQEKHEAAIASYRRAAVLDSTLSGECWGNIGWEYYRLGDLPASAAASRRALTLDPGLGYVRYNLALALVSQRELDEALRAYDKAWAADSTWGTVSGAMADLSTAQRQRPDLGEAGYVLGMLDLKKGWRCSAWREWTRCAALSPGTALAARASAGADTLALAMSQRLREAVAVCGDYLDALRADDEAKALGCWSRGARRGSDDYWQLADFAAAVDLARRDHATIAGATERGDVVELRVVAGRHELTYHVVREAGRARLANPADLLTRGWQRTETRHLVCHYRKGDGPTPLDLARLEESCAAIAAAWDLPPGPKIDYYKCESEVEVGRLFGVEPAVGRGNSRAHAVSAVLWGSFHELAHVLVGRTSRREPTSLILEGAACHWGGTSLITREAQLAWAKTLVESGRSLPIPLIADGNRFWSAKDMNDPYAEAASFVGFLTDEYGMARFKALYRYRDEMGDLGTALLRIYGKSVDRLGQEWAEWVSRAEYPAIEPGGNDRAPVVFRMDDPAGDDDGDGDYTYPLAPRYRPGMFDLTGFTVRSGAGRVYFELRYRDLVDWGDSSRWGFGGTFTEIAIDCGRQGGNDLPRYARATLLGHRDGSIEVSDQGVIVWRDGRVQGLLNWNPGRRRLGDADSERIAFSIPIAWLGEPQESWKYAVGVGGREGEGRTMRDGVGGLLAVTALPSAETGGGGVAEGLNPSFYDLLLPPGQDQRKILGGYDVAKRRLAALPMVGP